MASDLLAAAADQWPRLLMELAGLAPEQLQNRHQSCPACGGTDRYRWDRDGGPGGWYCNQCGGKEHRGGGGDGMDLLLRVTGWDFATAARRIEAHLGLAARSDLPLRGQGAWSGQRPAGNAPMEPAAAPLPPSPMPLEPVTPPMEPAVALLAPPSAPVEAEPLPPPLAEPSLLLAMVDPKGPELASGSPYAYSQTQRISRVERPGGKAFYANHLSENGWERGAGPGSWPMYQWAALQKAQAQWLVELEGEKCADLVIAGGLLATTQPGHAHQVAQIAERYLALRQAGIAGIVYVSDHDAQGAKRASQAIQAAAMAGLPLLHLPAIEIWPGLPAGGSIDDAPGGLHLNMAELAMAALTAYERWQVGPGPGKRSEGAAARGSKTSAAEPSTAEASTADVSAIGEGSSAAGVSPPPHQPPASAPRSSRPFQCLGFEGDNFYYQPRSTGQVMRLAASSHGAMNLCRLAPLAYWETLYPSKRGVSWTAAASDLFSQQAAVGIFDLESLRGRGAWWDQGRSVLHLGDRLVVDGISQPVIDDFASQFHYQRGAVIHGPGKAVPLSDEEALLVLAIADRFHWDVPASAMLLAGWVALAPLSGVLSWRPHIWLTAAAGSGKSAILERFVGVLLGDLALPVVGNTTEAFIRQALRSDALPVVIDEAESNEKVDQQRIQQILALARYASSETRASIGKGSVAGEVQRFRVRSMFLLSSISTALKQGADRRRFVQLTLRRPAELPGEERQSHWDGLNQDLSELITQEFAARLIARTVSLIPVIRRSIAVFTTVCSRHFDSQALGDQYGTLLAGAWALQSSTVPSAAEAQALIDGSDWSRYEQGSGLSDERRCLNRILQHPLRVETEDRVLTRTVGELVELLGSGVPSPLEPVSSRHAEELLSRHGMRVQEGSFLISNTAEAIARILEGSPWVSSWSTILCRLPSAQPTGNSVRFKGAGSKDRACCIPLDSL